MNGAVSAYVVTTSPLTVAATATSPAYPALYDSSSYTPTVGDRVAVVPIDVTKRLVICKVG